LFDSSDCFEGSFVEENSSWIFLAFEKKLGDLEGGGGEEGLCFWKDII
jgi:hypothetical protein